MAADPGSELAARYLERCQNPDGSWSAGDPFVCARAVLALDVFGGSEEAVSGGVGYLERCQASDGRFPAMTPRYADAATTAYVLVVLNHFHYSKASLPISRGLLWLLENQHEDGSWPGSNRHKNTCTTSLCLRALYTYYLSGISKYRAGLSHVLEKMTVPGFFDEPVSHVCAPVLNMARIGQLPDDSRAAFIRFAQKRLIPAMSAGAVADVAYLCGTLSALGEESLAESGKQWLNFTQNADGGYGKDLQPESEPERTALVLLSIANQL